jgi:hypothetical protein
MQQKIKEKNSIYLLIFKIEKLSLRSEKRSVFFKPK